jgi:hypothetical protein
MRLTFLVVLVPVAICAVLFAPGGLRGDSFPKQPPGLTIFFTGDNNGQISSCGCPEMDYGGASRRAKFIDTMRSNGWSFLALDAGGIVPWKELDSQARLKSETLASAMGIMAYDAVTLGEEDLALGAAFVRDLVARLGRPIVATNYDLDAGQSERVRFVNVQDRRVGIAAFLDSTLAAGIPWLRMEPWEAQRGWVDSLERASDFQIALLHAPDTTAAQRLLDLYPGIDLVVGADRNLFPHAMTKRGSSGIVGAPGEGRYLARAGVSFFPDGSPDLLGVIYLPVVQGWGHNEAVDSLVADYAREVKRLVFSGEFEKERLASLLDPVQPYVGSEACASCHQAETAQWKSTLHSHARETLVREGKDHDPECQRCHTTGYGYRTGFASPESTPERWNVGCESCHGPGGDHASSPKLPYGETREAICAGCHTPHNSPTFEYTTYRPKIVHR